jgi:cation:H+ antiporter
LGPILISLAAMVISTPLIWWGTNLLDKSIEELSEAYRVPEIVKGAILKAVGSSFPEFMSVILATIVHGDFVLGVASIVGSAIFNIAVIPGGAALVSLNQGLRVTRDVVNKDCLFYALAVASLFLIFAMALIYTPTGEPLVGELNRLHAVALLLLYVLYVFLQWLDVAESRQENAEGLHEDRHVNLAKALGTLFLSLVLITIGVEGLLYAAVEFGHAYNIPPFLWGMTFLAAITSLPDAALSIKDAMRGFDDSSIANVVGSNIFDLLVCIPAGILIAGTAPIHFGHATPMMGSLILITLLLFCMLRTGFTLSKSEGLVLLVSYALFCVWMLTETVGLTNVLNIR